MTTARRLLALVALIALLGHQIYMASPAHARDGHAHGARMGMVPTHVEHHALAGHLHGRGEIREGETTRGASPDHCSNDPARFVDPDRGAARCAKAGAAAHPWHGLHGPDIFRALVLPDGESPGVRRAMLQVFRI